MWLCFFRFTNESWPIFSSIFVVSPHTWIWFSTNHGHKEVTIVVLPLKKNFLMLLVLFSFFLLAFSFAQVTFILGYFSIYIFFADVHDTWYRILVITGWISFGVIKGVILVVLCATYGASSWYFFVHNTCFCMYETEVTKFSLNFLLAWLRNLH